MLPKKADWFALAQCEYFAVESLVQKLERPAMATVTPLGESISKRKLNSNTKWRETCGIANISFPVTRELTNCA